MYIYWLIFFLTIFSPCFRVVGQFCERVVKKEKFAPLISFRDTLDELGRLLNLVNSKHKQKGTMQKIDAHSVCANSLL